MRLASRLKSWPWLWNQARNEKLLDRILLENLLKILEPDERNLIYLRYFQEETQVSIAKKMGISQVQVSRMEKKILERLRKNLM